MNDFEMNADRQVVHVDTLGDAPDTLWARMERRMFLGTEDLDRGYEANFRAPYLPQVLTGLGVDYCEVGGDQTEDPVTAVDLLEAGATVGELMVGDWEGPCVDPRERSKLLTNVLWM